MNAKILFVSTVALALASSYAMADESKSATRDQVLAEYNKAAADGTLQRTDYDADANLFASKSKSKATRDEVLADMDASRNANKSIGPMRNRTYNQFGTELQKPSTVTRDEVKTSVVAAKQNGTLRTSDYDGVPATVARRAPTQVVPGPVLANASQRSPG